MTSKDQVVANQMHQVCVVVEDVQKAAKRYWTLFGIGPWEFYTLEPPELTDMVIHGESQPYSMKIGLAYVGEVQWELIQPLTGPSIYQEFLESHGEGVHHVAFGVDDFDRTVASMKEQGIGVLMSGCWRGTDYAYLDTEKALGSIVELFKYSPDFVMPRPDAVYPPPA